MVAWMLARLDSSYDRPAVCAALDEGRTWTWGELIAASVELATTFETMGLRRGQRLAHLGSHSPDWIVVDLACQLAGVVHVPLHADTTAGEKTAQLVWLKPQGIAWSGSCRGGNPVAGVPISIDLRPRPHARSNHGRSSNSLSDVGVSDVEVSDGGVSKAGVLESAGWQRRHADRDALRDEVAQYVESCDPDAVSTILLSSGTTGRPKGVMHSQRAVVANAVASTTVFLDEPDDVRLSWLPMSHSLARTGDLVTALVRGGCLNVVTDRHRVLDACRVLPPTVVLGVPAFFERLELAVESGRIPDLSAALGGRVRVCVSGGAALRARTAVAFSSRGLPLVQGYGLAEAGPVVTLSNPRIARLGTVGPAVDGVELKLDTRPATRGQLLVRTPSRALGVIDADTDEQPTQPEWLETGDLAAIDADGHVRITGRLVDTLVLSGGTKVPPAEVEAALAEDSVVAQVCVTGDGLSAPVALIVPEPTVLRAAIRRMGLRVWSRRAALRHPRVLQWLARRLARRQRQLPRGFRVRRAMLIGRPFDAAHGEATESLKLRRKEIAAHFATELAAAAELMPPSWIAVVSPGPPCGPQHADTTLMTASLMTGGKTMATRSSWAAASLWGDSQSEAVTPSGFSLAAALAAEPLRAAVADVVERAGRTIAELRGQSLLYDAANPAAASAWSPAPLDDAPAAPVGKFSPAAEAALGEAGLWGLLVPERFGGTGCTMQELARVITRVAADVPTAAGMLSVHSSIGAVSALTAFGSEMQQERHLPGLAQGIPLSIFGATEPDAGCDLHAISSRLDRQGDRLLLSGTKMFITGATYGRLMKLIALLDGRPAVVLVRLPDSDTPSFRLRHYRLHPLKHAHNAAIEFTQHEVPASDILQPPEGSSDAMRIVWHGLNRGRIALAAQAAGTLRLLVRQARDHALRRRTWGEPIASRELVQGRLARIAAGIVACDSLAAWAAAAIDAEQSGELEAIIAKVVAGECVRDGAINSLGVHGGRAFLVGHPLGDSFHDHFAVTVYEGESDLLGLALFKGLAKHHPLASLARETTSGKRAAAWLAWRIGMLGRRPHRDDFRILDRRLRDHAATARRLLDAAAVRIDRGIRRQGKALVDRQLLVGGWSAEVRDLVSVLAVAHHADATGDDGDLLAADCWCRLALARGRGMRLTAADHAALAALGRQVVER